MPRYRFEFRENEVNPPIFVNLVMTRQLDVKLQVTRQTMLDRLAEGVDPTDWTTRLYNRAGHSTNRIRDLPPASEAKVLRSG